MQIINGDCLKVLKTFPENSIDAIVTDPPYGLAFMGKKWDYDVPSVEVWAECLRVLKPGGHLLAFAGPRTQHRMAVKIEDAGFEIRDMIAWVYGSGFPKSLDVSKAIDRMDASEEQERRQLRFTAWVRSTGATSRQIDESTGTHMGGHYTTAVSQPAIMTREHLEQCRHLLGDVPEWVEREADIRSVESRNMAEREVVSRDYRSANESWLGTAKRGEKGFGIGEWDITAPATPAARQWHGWGTALKPALEPITVARKPLIGTVAENVLTWGTGALNIDGCRIVGDDTTTRHNSSSYMTGKIGEAQPKQAAYTTGSPLGRWPANLIHDGSDEVVGLFPGEAGGRNPGGRKRYAGVRTGKEYTIGDLPKNHKDHVYGGGWAIEEGVGYNDSGSAARFFYCAKASKRDRDEGLDGLETKTTMRYGEQGQGPSAQQTPRKPVEQRNIHPTVKPTALMRYLCRLVTPPGGVVLDPFTGSGSTGKGAVLESFDFIGIEQDSEYCQIATKRIAYVMNFPLEETPPFSEPVQPKALQLTLFD